MATQKGKGKHSRNRSKSSIDNSEWDKDSVTDVSSEGEKPLLKRGDFICSTGHNVHLKEDFEPNETLLVGRKVRSRKPKSIEKRSNDSHSIRSFPSDLTLSSQTSLSGVSPTLPATLKDKHLQTVPEEAETRNNPRLHYPYAPSPTSSDFDSPRTWLSSTSSSRKNVTPTTTRKKIGLLGRLWTSEDRPPQTVNPQARINRNLDFFDIAARSANRNSNVVNTYEPNTYNETPKQFRKQMSTGSLTRSTDSRLLMPRESVVHPTGPLNEPLDVNDETTSYATVFDLRTGRQTLVRRDSIIHPNEDGRSHYDRLTRRKNSIVRPLQTQPSPNLYPKMGLRKLMDRYTREEIEQQREESIKRHLLNRHTPIRSLGVSFAPTELTDYLPAPKYINGRFEVPWETQHKPGLFDAIRWKLTSTDRSRVPKDDELRKILPIIKPNFKVVPENGIRVTWLGHSTLLLQMDDMNILTDPIFSERASPLWLMGPKRYRRSPCSINSLPRIDIVLISHNHYDHLDSESVRALNNRFGANLHWFVPLGLHDWMKKIGCQNTYEMSWWEEMRPTHARDIIVAFTPAQHWCKRALTDDNKVLWGSWCVIGARHNFFFAGDSGYCDVFKLIGEKYGPFDLAAIPIGAYEPRWFMKLQNVNPFEAVLIHEDVYARQSIGIHWGTFALTPEHYLAPRKDLTEALNRRALPQNAFFTLSHGESKIVAGTTTTSKL